MVIRSKTEETQRKSPAVSFRSQRISQGDNLERNRGSHDGKSASFFIIIILSGVRLSPLGTAATTGLLYQARMIDDGDCGAIGGMKIDRGHRSTRRKPAPAPLCPPQIPHDQNRARTRAAAVGSRRLTA
jgi:hypothetical protein